MFKIIITSVFAFALIPTSAIAGEGPFGIDWGNSISEIEAMGVTCSNKSTKDRFTICKTASLPKNLSISEEYVLYFDKKYYLQKVKMTSKDIDNDISGSDGKETYSDLKSKLTAKYGAPTNSYEYIGRKLWDEYDEFYQCLAYSGCGAWISFFKSKAGEVVALQLNGLGRGQGYITLTYEGPSWSNAVDAYRSKESEADADAL